MKLSFEEFIKQEEELTEMLNIIYNSMDEHERILDVLDSRADEIILKLEKLKSKYNGDE